MAAAITITERRTIVGFVLDEETLRRIESVTKSIIQSPAVGYPTELSTSVSVRQLYNSTDREYDTVDALIEDTKAPDFSIQRLSVRSKRSYEAAASVQFWADGGIDISGFSSDPEFAASAERLKHEVSACDQGYSWPVRTLIFKRWPREALSLSTLACFVMLILFLLYFVLWQRSLVNVDSSILVTDDEYYRELATALKSSSANQKLDVLLRSQIRGFRDARPTRILLQRSILFLSLTLVVLLLLGFVRRAVARLYPPAFFALGAGVAKLRRLERRRDVWMVAIIASFIVNIAAGLIVAILV